MCKHCSYFFPSLPSSQIHAVEEKLNQLKKNLTGNYWKITLKPPKNRWYLMPIIEELQIFSISKHTQISLETYTEMLYLHILHKLQTMFLYKEQSGMESVEQQVLQ